MAEICEAAGLPAGVFNVLTADRQVSEYLVRHPGVDKVSFTGSTLAGKRIASICGERIARVTLELGGKSAGIVLDDYDLDLVAQSLSKSATYLTGQACSSLTRIIVSKHRQSQLLESLAHHFGQIKVGDPFDVQTGMGPLATAKHRERVEGFIAKGCDGGGTLVTGGKRPPHTPRGHFVEPTVFGNISNDSMIAREEIFGPVLSVIPVANEQAAVATANDSIYGLNASVFTHDAERAYAIGRQLRTGTVGQNAFRSDFSIAFGGFKQSGLGREGGVEGILPYLETKTLILDELPRFLRA
jgi:acyl-CoA reductase-like NAD-dependent aldehyde dehydrogenase